MLKVNIYATAVSGFFLAGMRPVALAEERIFFFGNSYTFYSGGQEKMVQALLEEASNTAVEAQASAISGRKLTSHLRELDGSRGDTAARQALITRNNTSWDLVVLQEQSLIPGYYYEDSDLWRDSLEAAVEIQNLIKPTGAVTMLLLTWGRQKGLKDDEYYTDFPTMQQYLTGGYREYQQAANDPRSFVAPAGLAFQLIYNDTVSAGGTDTSSPFSDLYDDDDESHPSIQGSYLSACTIYAAYTGLSVAELDWAPEGIGTERRDYLQSKADEAVFNDDTFFPSRRDVQEFGSPSATTSVMPSVALSASPSAVPSISPSVARSDMPSPVPSVSPSAKPSVAPSSLSLEGNPGLLAVESATEVSTAPRTTGMMTNMLLVAAIAWVSFS